MNEPPVLGHQLQMLSDYPGSAKGWYRIVPVRAQSLLQFGVYFAQGAGLVLLILAVLYLPDFAFDYAHRGSEFLDFFAKYLGILAVILLAAAAIITIRRMQAIYVNPGEGKVLQCGFWRAPDFENAVSLTEFSRFTRVQSGMIPKTTLLACFPEGTEPLFEVYGASPDVEKLEQWMTELLEPRGNDDARDETAE